MNLKPYFFNHPWLSMDDEELLRSEGLILLDHESRREGITLAAILLFGKDTTIMSAHPQHKNGHDFSSAEFGQIR